MNLWNDVTGLFFPRFCLSCGKKLGAEEWGMCIRCWSRLPFTRLEISPDNEMAKCFWGRFPVEQAYALLYYTKGGEVAGLLHDMKYHGARRLCREMGKRTAEELKTAGFFASVDYLLPVPLARARLRERGYNQSELLARGIAEETGIPLMTDAVTRVRNNATQTHETAYGRWSNVKGLFVATPKAGSLCGKHVLLVDDVLTTGATLVACADALSQIEGISFSVVTLAWAR